MVPVIGPLEHIADHIVGPKGTGAITGLVAIPVRTVEISHWVGTEDRSVATFEGVIALKIVGPIGIEPVAPRVFTAVVTTSGAFPFGFSRQSTTDTFGFFNKFARI